MLIGHAFIIWLTEYIRNIMRWKKITQEMIYTKRAETNSGVCQWQYFWAWNTAKFSLPHNFSQLGQCGDKYKATNSIWHSFINEKMKPFHANSISFAPDIKDYRLSNGRKGCLRVFACCSFCYNLREDCVVTKAKK